MPYKKITNPLKEQPPPSQKCCTRPCVETAVKRSESEVDT